jgi:hypothetical protein
MPNASPESGKSDTMRLSWSVNDRSKAMANVWKTDMRLHPAGKNLDSKRNSLLKNDMARLLAG